MSPPRRDAPTNLASLQARVRNVAQERGQQPRRIQRAVASTVVGQMLPDGVVKGGTAMKIRVGEAGSRYTPDFDASRHRRRLRRAAARPPRARLERLHRNCERARTAAGRGRSPRLRDAAFRDPARLPGPALADGRARTRPRRGRQHRGQRSEDRRRHSRDLRDHRSRSAGADSADVGRAPNRAEAARLHLREPEHDCNERAHDLVDLQILGQEEAIDYAKLREIGARLFAARRAHEWPPAVVEYDNWDTIYAEAAEGLDVLPTVTEAVAWANDLVVRAGG